MNSKQGRRKRCAMGCTQNRSDCNLKLSLPRSLRLTIKKRWSRERDLAPGILLKRRFKGYKFEGSKQSGEFKTGKAEKMRDGMHTTKCDQSCRQSSRSSLLLFDKIVFQQLVETVRNAIIASRIFGDIRAFRDRLVFNASQYARFI